MKVEYAIEEKKAYAFEDIAISDVFQTPTRNNTFMKVLAEPSGKTILNAVCLNTGTLVEFGNCEEVIPLDAKLVIEKEL